MTNPTTTLPMILKRLGNVDRPFERFCLTAGIGAIEQMRCEDTQQLAGQRWGRTKGKIGVHGDLLNQRNNLTG